MACASTLALLTATDAPAAQVLGHTKTILVLLASWVVFQEPMTPRKLCGMALAVAGMVGYGYAASAGTPRRQAAATTAAAEQQAGIATGARHEAAAANDTRSDGAAGSDPSTPRVAITTAEVVLRTPGSSAAKQGRRCYTRLNSHPIHLSGDLTPTDDDSSVAASVMRRRRGGGVAVA